MRTGFGDGWQSAMAQENEQRRRRRPSLHTAVLTPLLVLVLLPVVVNVATSSLPVSWERYLWLAWPACILLAGFAIAGEVRAARERAAATAEPERLTLAADDLANAVQSEWQAEAMTRGLNQPEPIRLHWSLSTRKVSGTAAAIRTGPAPSRGPVRLTRSGSIDSILAAFERLPNRQLVILGEPGAGKTVLALTLTLELLANRRPGDPVPVLVTLAGWNPHDEHLSTWLGRKLSNDFPALASAERYGPDAAAHLVESGLVFPILDGLDEMPPSLHSAAITAIGVAISGSRPLALTCRSEEYERAVRSSGSVLPTALVVEMDKVDAKDAMKYISASGELHQERWQPVFAYLRERPDHPLAAALSTPLMIWLAKSSYRSPATDPTELLDTERFPKRSAIEDHLLDSYLAMAYPTEAPHPTMSWRQRYEARNAIAWLGFLARLLRAQGTRDLAWWRLHEALPKGGTPLIGLTVGAVLAAIATCLLLAAPNPSELGVFLLAPVAVAPTMGLLLGVHGPPGQVAQVSFSLHGDVRGRIARFLFGVVLGSALGSGGLLLGNLDLGLLLMAFGLVIGVFLGLVHRPDIVQQSSPESSLRGDKKAFWAFVVLGAVIGTAGGALGGMVVRTAAGWFAGMIVLGLVGTMIGVGVYKRRAVLSAIIGTGCGMAVGALAGAWLGGDFSGPYVITTASGLLGLSAGVAAGLGYTSSGWFMLSHLTLAMRGKLPFLLTAFLQDAHRRGVLRQVGAVYQFRHARLQDRLADPAPGMVLHHDNRRPVA